MLSSNILVDRQKKIGSNMANIYVIFGILVTATCTVFFMRESTCQRIPQRRPPVQPHQEPPQHGSHPGNRATGHPQQVPRQQNSPRQPRASHGGDEIEEYSEHNGSGNTTDPNDPEDEIDVENGDPNSSTSDGDPLHDQDTVFDRPQRETGNQDPPPEIPGDRQPGVPPRDTSRGRPPSRPGNQPQPDRQSGVPPRDTSRGQPASRPGTQPDRQPGVPPRDNSRNRPASRPGIPPQPQTDRQPPGDSTRGDPSSRPGRRPQPGEQPPAQPREPSQDGQSQPGRQPGTSPRDPSRDRPDRQPPLGNTQPGPDTRRRPEVPPRPDRGSPPNRRPDIPRDSTDIEPTRPEGPNRRRNDPQLPAHRERNPQENDNPQEEEIDDSEPSSEQKRSPQRGRGVDTRNTVCETVCSCQQTAAYCNDADLRSIPTPFPQRLEQITIEQNPLESIPANEFAAQLFSSITALNLNSNQIKRIGSRAFSGLSNARELSIKSNRLSTFEEDAFGGLSNLQTLTLTDNKLKKLNPNAFSRGMSLRSLIVDDNELKSLPSELFDVLPSLTSLTLGGNPWECNCDLLGLFVWLQTPSNQLQGSAAKCSSPTKMKDRRLDGLTNKDVETMCKEDANDEEEETIEEAIEENCKEHNSSNIINICYISDPVYSQPGKRVCIHCVATVDVDEFAFQYDSYEEVVSDDDIIIEWEIPYKSSDTENSTIFNRTLCIEEIQASDSGEYKCIASLVNSTDEKTVKITVDVLPNKVAVGLAIFVASSVFLSFVFFAKWWASELRALKQ